MIKTRVIPCLLLSNQGLVKTVSFKAPNYVGDPINVVKIFNEKEVDELILLDIDASRKFYAPDLKLIKNIVSEAFMPIAYGGGIKTLAQAKKLVECGVEKVIVNSSALENINLIKELSRSLGSSSTVVSIDLKKDWLGRYRIFNPRTRKLEKFSWKLHLKNVLELGAGEIFINDISRDGTGKGFDLAIIAEISSMIDVPLITCGGAGTLEHLYRAAKAGASGVAAGSMFVYMGKHRAVMINYPKYELLEEVFVNV